MYNTLDCCPGAEIENQGHVRHRASPGRHHLPPPPYPSLQLYVLARPSRHPDDAYRSLTTLHFQLSHSQLGPTGGTGHPPTFAVYSFRLEQ